MESRVSPQPQGRRAAHMALVWTLVGALGILVVASLALTSLVGGGSAQDYRRDLCRERHL